MKFFKHFTDAHRGKSLNQLRDRLGWAALAKYWTFVEICAEKLEKEGFTDCQVVEGGTLGWAEAGLPVNRGTTKVISLERQVRIAAGLLVLTGVALGTWVHPGFYGISAFVGAGLTFAGITDWCGMAMLLAKMPWNQRPVGV